MVSPGVWWNIQGSHTTIYIISVAPSLFGLTGFDTA